MFAVPILYLHETRSPTRVPAILLEFSTWEGFGMRAGRRHVPHRGVTPQQPRFDSPVNTFTVSKHMRPASCDRSRAAIAPVLYVPHWPSPQPTPSPPRPLVAPTLKNEIRRTYGELSERVGRFRGLLISVYVLLGTLCMQTLFASVGVPPSFVSIPWH
jgi:hypothetical protein